MSLNLVGQLNLALAKANVNAVDFVDKYNKAFYGRTILVPKGAGQIEAFVFDYRGDEEVRIDTDVTDHFVEDNTAVQDHIGIKPITVTLKGFQSELALSKDLVNLINQAFSKITNSLSQVSAYLGAYTPGAVDNIQKTVSQAQNVAIQIEQAAARAAYLSSFFAPGPAMNKQQKAYFALSSLALGRTAFTVVTPFQTFDNMVITSLRALQPKETRGWSDFTVTMKQLQYTQDLSLSFYSSNAAGRAAGQAQPSTNNGAVSGTPVPSNTVSNAFPAP